MVSPPQTEQELLERLRQLSGLRLSEVAGQLGLSVPPDLRRAKGWVGELMERALGATAGSRATPDFEGLGIELKTLPVRGDGTPVETTFVCTIPLLEMAQTEWHESRLYHKLARVLWVPVEGERQIPVGQRRIGSGWLWSPTEAQERDLRFDWEELAGRIGRGDVESITGHLGRYLQVRPKAANGKARRLAFGEGDERIATLPRGFYLRPAFTGRLLQEHFQGLAGSSS